MASSLTQVARRVPRLDGEVNRDQTIPPLVDGDFVIFRGFLNFTGRIIVIKRHRFMSRNYEGIEVMSSFIFAVPWSHIYAAYSPGDHHLVTTLSREH